MYARYEKRTVTDGSTRFVKVKEVSLLGRDNGCVPELLAQKLRPDWTEPRKKILLR